MAKCNYKLRAIFNEIVSNFLRATAKFLESHRIVAHPLFEFLEGIQTRQVSIVLISE